MLSKFSPKDFENEILEVWSDRFVADENSDKPSFVMMMPPPNITGKLHMGHALNNTLQDSIARYKRMSGFNTLWLPGTDHASIATELKVVQLLKSQGIEKHDLTREEFLKKCFEWKDEYNGTIVHQLSKLGCSVDWSRLAFTMDEQCNIAVNNVFVDLYNQGLIYRGHRIINWCVDCKTALSDAEVEYVENDGHIWHINYDIEGGGTITVATTRPETMLGDTAVVVHPNDRRYKDIVGKYAILPLIGRKIKILADEYVDMTFGSGAVKVTPAHDPNDFEIGQRHDLESIKILDDSGKVIGGTPYDGMDRMDARKQIITDLQASGNLLKTEHHHNTRGHCYRCNSVVEPSLSLQWFVKMQPLAEPAIKAVQDDLTQFVPRSYTKIYMHWMQNIKDWCISRQLWWGHRIPAYHCESCGHIDVSTTKVEKCTKCGGSVSQDEAVLDTWFSSALWPFSTLGYPDETIDLKKFYPGALLVTAYDIIFFWVARMIFSGLHHMGSVPFEKVLIHGIVRASDGKKMSKSLGNGVDPIDIIDNYGTDSLRFCLLSGVALGSDIRYSDERLQKAQAFCNKIFNASKFVEHNISDMLPISVPTTLDESTLTLADKWILSRLHDCIAEINTNFDKYEIGRVADCLYDFVWDDFCDWYIEISKVQIASDKATASDNTTANNKSISSDKALSTDSCRSISVLVYVYDQILKLLHPVVPFVTEYCYQNLLASDGRVLALQDFADSKYTFSDDSNKFESIRQLIIGIRALRVSNNIAQNKKPALYIIGFENDKSNSDKSNSEISSFDISYINSNLSIIQKLTASGDISILANTDPVPENVAQWNLDSGNIYLQLEKVDNQVLIAKLQKDKKEAESELNLAQSKLNNQGFVSKAPEKMIQIEQEKVQKFTNILNKVQVELDALN